MSRRRSSVPGLLAVLIAGSLALGACSSAKPAAAPAPSGPERIEVTVAHRTVTPAPVVHQVRLGQEVVLTVTSDQGDEVHLHGYDKEIEIAAGQPGTIDFTADLPGIFEVETHDSGLQLLQIEVK